MTQNTLPKVNLGQSQFQDAMFVVGAQLTPFRKLRQCELEIRSLEDAVKQHEFSVRKNKVKISRLDLSDELNQIEKEELEWGMMRAMELLSDAQARLDQFRVMKSQIIDSMPLEYWATGYEQSELEYWPQYFGRKMALEVAATGQPSIQTAEQMMLLPDELKKKALDFVGQELPKLIGPKNQE